MLILMLSIALVASGWAAGGAGATAGAAKKPKCPQGQKGIEQIEPQFDINANIELPLNKRMSVVQFGHLKAVRDQMKVVDANNPVDTVRAQPMSNIEFLDNRSATATLVITLDPERTQTLEQGTQYFVCVGKKENGTKKGAWRISLYSLCSLYQLNPCSEELTTKAIDGLTPSLLELTTQETPPAS